MTRAYTIAVCTCWAVFTWGAAAHAQQTHTLDGARDAGAYCDHSRPTEDDADAGADYDDARREIAHRPTTVKLGPDALSTLGYDRIAGVLLVGAFGTIDVFNGFGLRFEKPRTLQFELTPERAADLRARYETGYARLELTFLPAAYARWDRPLCTTVVEGDEKREIIRAALLSATFVDPVGKPIATFRTELGHEVEMMRTHRIRGFLDTTIPTVTVSSLVFHASRDQRDALPDDLRRGLTDDIQRRFYGCYLRGLVRNARLQGAVVFRLETGDGESTSVSVLVDSLHDPGVVSCARERLERIVGNRQRALDDHPDVKATVIFKLADAGSL